MKECTKCKTSLSLESFNKQKLGKLGRRASCRTCQNTANREYKQTDRGKQLNREWKKTDKGKACKQRYKDGDQSKQTEKLYWSTDAYKQARAKRLDRDRFGGNRFLVLERDNHKCKECNSTYRIQVHHIDELGRNKPKMIQNNDPSNLITLCASCHIKQHNPVLKRWAK